MVQGPRKWQRVHSRSLQVQHIPRRKMQQVRTHHTQALLDRNRNLPLEQHTMVRLPQVQYLQLQRELVSRLRQQERCQLSE